MSADAARTAHIARRLLAYLDLGTLSYDEAAAIANIEPEDDALHAAIPKFMAAGLPVGAAAGWAKDKDRREGLLAAIAARDTGKQEG